MTSQSKNSDTVLVMKEAKYAGIHNAPKRHALRDPETNQFTTAEKLAAKVDWKRMYEIQIGAVSDACLALTKESQRADRLAKDLRFYKLRCWVLLAVAVFLFAQTIGWHL